MTLTDILPTLRSSIPTPLAERLWPEHTHPTTTDVIVGGVSLLRLLENGGSPAVLTGDLPHPKAAAARAIGIGSDVTVLVFTVTLRVDTQNRKSIALADCSFDGVDAHWEECRLIGRASTARDITIELLPGEEGASTWPHPCVRLPADLREGDVLAVPCAGAVTLHDVRPRRASAPMDLVATTALETAR